MKFAIMTATIVALTFTVVIPIALAAPAGNVSSPGKPLTDIGEMFDDPLLSLTGEVINNLAKELRSEIAEIAEHTCRIHPCSLWTEWTPCDYNALGKYERYGSSNRTRNCGLNTSMCAEYGDKNFEYDFKVCKCKDGYTITTHGYCIKFSSNAMNRDAATATCHDEGGYLVNVGSARKLNDLNETSLSLPSQLWIDGYRSTPNSQWKFENEPEDPAFTRWYSGHPSSSNSRICMILYHISVNHVTRWYWYDATCTGSRYFMCEIMA